MSIREAVNAGMGARRALEIWGEIVLRDGYSGIYPPGFGWPSAGIEGRLKDFGHGAKESTALAVDSNGDPVLTRPEAAVHALQADRSIAAFVASIVRDCTDMHRVYAHLYYVRGKCWADIAEQMDTGQDHVQRMAHAVTTKVRRAMGMLKVKMAA